MAPVARMCVLLVCWLSQISGADHLQIHNNRYDNLVIAISPDITEDHAIIEQLKNMTKEASVFLYEATRKRAYFGHVKILVPETWTPDQSWGQSTVETFEEANIRVDRPHPSYGPNPYTFQPEGCGRPAKYIHLTEEYVLDRNGDRAVNWGPPGRTIVHEFAHLRYGVFDEYGLGTKEYPNFYIEDTTAYPTACTYSIRGHIEGKCDPDPKTNLPKDPECYFLGDVKQNSAKVSIMYDPSIETMTTFCESNTNDPDMTHNTMAPNQQNKMCNKKGTWDIIKDHVDFKGANPPVNKSLSDLEPTFTIIRSTKKRTSTGAEVCGRPVVLVLDVSGSMEGERIFKQTQTATKFIEDILPVGTQVGVVSFSKYAKVLVGLTTLSNRQDRLSVAEHIPVTTESTTAIGKGLLEAKKMLEDAHSAAEGRIILITDGEENELPLVADIKQTMSASGVTVHTLAYSMDAADALQTLSRDTGGEYAYFSESAVSTSLDSILQTVLEDISVCSHDTRIEISRKSIPIIPNGHVMGHDTIDDTASNGTMFVFTAPEKVPLTVELSDPVGAIYTSTSPEYDIDRKLNIIRFNFKITVSGTWQYTLSSPQSGIVTVVTKAKPSSNTAPYEIKSWVTSTAKSLATVSNKAPIAYVHVHKGYSPVIHADVKVSFERPDGTMVEFSPHDDGQLPDNMADDGVYSTYVVAYGGNKRYSMDVNVKSNSGTYYFVQGNRTYGAAISRHHDKTPPVKTELTGNFTRSGSPGAMDVHGFVAGKDNFAPSRVTDLSVTAFSTESSTVTLTWTAPGDDLDQGTAKSYELRMSKSLKLLTNSFNKCLIVNPTMLKEGSLTPLPAKSPERIVVQTPKNWTTIFFGLRTRDEAGHASDLSNFITATFKKVTFQGQTTPAPLPLAPPAPAADLQIGIIVAVVCGLLGGSLVIGGTILIVYRTKKRNIKVILPENPLGAVMTEPSIPANVTIAA